MTTTAGLLNTPTDGPSFDRWSFDLDQNIRDISAAIRTQKNVALPQYQISPVTFVDIGEWLGRVSDIVGQIAGVLKINAADIENVDLADERARQAWANEVYRELTAARQALKI